MKLLLEMEFESGSSSSGRKPSSQELSGQNDGSIGPQKYLDPSQHHEVGGSSGKSTCTEQRLHGFMPWRSEKVLCQTQNNMEDAPNITRNSTKRYNDAPATPEATGFHQRISPVTNHKTKYVKIIISPTHLQPTSDSPKFCMKQMW